MAHDSHAYHQPVSRLSMNRMGLWLFFISEGFMFAGILASRFALLPGQRPPLNQTLGLVVTAVLLASSFFMYRAETAIAHDDRKTFVSSSLIAMVMGIVFLIGVVGVEWRLAAAEGITPSSGMGGSLFYFMTGVHAFHVLTGVIFIYFVWNNGRKGNYSADDHWGVESCALYWHFVDVVWVFIYAALYLVGTPIH